MKSQWLIAIAMGCGFAACTSDSGGAGNGGDTLPKRGQLASDPTIVSATARCSPVQGGGGGGGGTGGGGTSTTSTGFDLEIAGSDPQGAANLGTCAATLGTVSDQQTFATSGTCYLYLDTNTACTAGTTVTVGLTVGNKTAGVTTASVKLTISP